MKKLTIAASLMMLLMSGCSSVPETDNSNEAESATQQTTTTPEATDTTTVTDETAKTTTDEAVKTESSTATTRPEVKPKPMPKVQPIKTPDGKLILGEQEWVHLRGLDVNTVARVDTGASTSSISAIDIVPFERDGQDWVKFKLSHEQGTSSELELPVERTIHVRQSSSTEASERYVVKGWIQVGDLQVETPFTLADRTHMNFGLLLGRTFFRDIAVVDVSRKFIQPKVEIKK